jgi:stringent starvation protein B
MNEGNRSSLCAMSPQPLPPKKVVALALIEQSSVHLHLDPRAPGVVVPAWFKQQPQLVLQVGMNLPVPIPDLYFDDEKMSCTLSFNRSPFFCIVPWDAVFAMRGDDGRGMVWPESLPPEVAKAGTAPREATPAEVKEKEKAAKAPAKAAAKKTAAKKSDGKKETKKSAAKSEGKSAKKTATKKSATKKPAKAAKKGPKKTAKEKPKTESRPDARVVRLPSESRKNEEAPPRAAQAKKPQSVSREPSRSQSGKPKRELPPYLRVVK